MTQTKAVNLEALAQQLQEDLQTYLAQDWQLSCLLQAQNLVILVSCQEPAAPETQKSAGASSGSIPTQAQQASERLRHKLEQEGLADIYSIFIYFVGPRQKLEEDSSAVIKYDDCRKGYSEEIIFRLARQRNLNREPIDAIAELPFAQRQNSTVKIPPAPTQLAKKLCQFSPVAVVMGISLLALSTVAYGITRPCVFSQCQSEPQLELQNEAVNRLKAAREAARIAQSGVVTSQSLAELEQVEAAWQNAISHLKEMSPQTAGYAEGQQLLTNYGVKLAAAQERKNQEQKAIELFSQAARQAGLAQNAQANQQWSDAVTQWRGALNSLRQMPQNTFQYRESGTLFDYYSQALQQAGTKLQTQQLLDRVRSDLTKLCLGQTQMCSFAIGDREIVVNLLVNYLQKVQQTATQVKIQGDRQAQKSLLEHVTSLETGFTTISNNTGMLVKVYNAEGMLMITYRPKD